MKNKNIVSIQAMRLNPAHLSEDTRQLLHRTPGTEKLLIQTDSPDIANKTAPDDLTHVLEFAKSNRCRLVILDPDAECVRELPIFNDSASASRTGIISKSLRDAYVLSGLLPKDFPAAIQVLFKKPGIQNADMPGTDVAILTIYHVEELQDKWQEHCTKSGIHPESVVQITKLCDM